MTFLDLAQLIDSLARTFGLTHAQLARVLAVDPREVRRWYAGTTFPQGRSRTRLDALNTLAQRLHETFASDEAIQRWLRSDSRYLGCVKPLELLQVQRLDRINAALEAIDSGYVS